MTSPLYLLELVNTLTTIADYKPNIAKSVTFLYAKDRHTEKIGEAIPFSIKSTQIKYFGISLTK